VAFHHWATIPSSTSQLHLVRGSLTAAACLVEDGENFLGRWRGVDRRDGLWDADGQNASHVEGLTQGGIIDTKIARHRVDLERLWRADAVDGTLDLVEQGQHLAEIARVARWSVVGKDKARGRFRDNTRLSTELGGAIALAFHDGGDGQVVRIDEFTVAEFLTLGEPS
jgi:hypothetical protein